MTQGIVNCRLFDGEAIHDGLGVVIDGDRISTIAVDESVAALATDVIDLNDMILAPGLIDLQVNGGGGLLFNTSPNADSLARIAAAHRRFGTTSLLPALITDTVDVMAQGIAAVKEAISNAVPGIIGIHLEGPHLNPARRGVHDAEHMRTLDHAALEHLCSLDAGKTLVTLAPETVAADAIAALRRAGVIVCAGHSAATYDEVRAAIEAGLSGFTHLFNAMSPMASRAPGMVGAALDDPNTWVGIIADGHHVHPAVLGIAIRAKARGKTVLVSDAMPTVGGTSTTFDLYGEEVRAVDGRCVTTDGSLAGSDIALVDAVRYLSNQGIVELPEALRMASAYPAAALGVDDRLGYIRPGYAADLVVLGPDLDVSRTWVAGQMEVYD